MINLESIFLFYFSLQSLVLVAEPVPENRRLLFTNFDANPLRSESGIVTITNGRIRGTSDSNTEAFLGIPYALPPVGHRRFRRPISIQHERWSGIKEARITGPMCVQRSAFFASSPIVGNEDCLYLNVYRPKSIASSSSSSSTSSTTTGSPDLESGASGSGSAETTLLPVMVFIPGGAFAVGSSYWLDGQFDGSQIALDEKVIVVVMNYRLNIFGFFASPQLEQANGGTVGNLALQDQQEALRWVKREIVHFGGDPEKILLFGESAGGFSVVWHSVNIHSQRENLFHSVISQSATTDLSWFFQAKQDAFNLYSAFAYYIGCPISLINQLECLQALPAKYFLKAWNDWSTMILESQSELRGAPIDGDHHPEAIPLLHLLCAFGPVIDGHEDGLLDTPAHLIKAGRFHRVPLVAGITRGEGSIFTLILPLIVASSHAPMTVDQWMEIAELIVQKPDAIRELYRLYPLRRIEGILGAREWANEIVRDLCFGCSTEEMVNDWGDFAPSWLYLFSATLGPIGPALGVDAMHSFDLHYVFKNFFFGASFVLGKREMRIADDMSSRWASMARSFNPNTPLVRNSGDDFIEWPQFRESNLIMEFGVPDTSRSVMDRMFENLRTSMFWSKDKGTEEVPISRLFNRDTAPKSHWPSRIKCDYWKRQRPLPWINHQPTKGFDSREDAMMYLEQVIEMIRGVYGNHSLVNNEKILDRCYPAAVE